MTLLNSDSAKPGQRKLGSQAMHRASAPTPLTGALGADSLLNEVEAIALIGSYSTDFVAGCWTSSKGLDAIFGIDAAFERSVEGWVSLVHPADRNMMVKYLADEVIGEGHPFDRQYRVVRADTGEERWVHGRGALEFDRLGRPIRMLGTIADITEQRRTQEALIASEVRSAAVFEGTAQAILIADVATFHYRWVNPAACALLGYSQAELVGRTLGDIHPARDLPRLIEQFKAVEDGRISEARSVPCVRKDGTLLLADIRASTVVLDGVRSNIAFFTDVSELRRLEAEDRKLAQALGQTSDAVVITDLAGTIEYVNPAFGTISGYQAEEVIGANPRIVKSGRQSAAFYRAVWRRLTSGEIWTGRFSNRRADGTLYEVEATISPIRDPAGLITGYMGVERDVTALQDARSSLSREFRERAEVAAALGHLEPGPTAEATAAIICDGLLGLPGIDLAAIIHFVDPNRAVPIAMIGPVGLPPVAGRPLPAAFSTYLYERAATGPWGETWGSRPAAERYGPIMAEIGVQAIAYAPIRAGEVLLGVVAAGTRDDTYAQHLIDHLPAVGEFAATASALLSGQLDRGRRDGLVRERVRRVLADRAYAPVFQPIVALASGDPVGYEALTRFHDGTPPDELIADAHRVGLGIELELALIAAALDASDALPADAWLSLNAAPDVILQIDELAGLLTGRARRIVLEVTEHVQIDDYPSLRRAVARLGPTVSLSVDDAGSGFASLRHVVELRPRFLKLDVSLVRGVGRDETRQAMIAGLTHFAGRVGCEVIAEGIEEEAELLMLREIGVPLGQGYLLGRPETIPLSPDGLGRPAVDQSVGSSG